MNIEKLSINTGHVFFIGLIISASFLYKERLFAFDTAYYTFHVLNYGEFFIKHQRFISYLTQWILLLGRYFHLPLTLILPIFSASFYIWFYLVYVIIVYVFKNTYGGLFLLLSMILTMRYKFFAAISEITFALCLAAALIVLIDQIWQNKRATYKEIIWFGVISIGILGSHLAVLYPIGISLLALFLGRKAYKNWFNWIWPALLGMVFLLKFIWVQKDSYESSKLAIVGKEGLIKDLITNASKYPIVDILKDYLVLEYLPIIIVFCLMLSIFVLRKQYWMTLIISLGFLGWWLVNALLYSYLNDHILIMVDGYLALLGPIISIPIYFFLTEKSFAEGAKKIWVLVTILLLLFSCFQMLDKRKFFHQRMAHIQQTAALNADCESRKLLITNEQFDWKILWYPYELPHETLLLSALNGREQCYTMYANTDSAETADFLKSTGFLQFNQAGDLGAINNSVYFMLPEKRYCNIDTISW